MLLSLCLRDAAVPLGVGREASFLGADAVRINAEGGTSRAIDEPPSALLVALALGATEENHL